MAAGPGIARLSALALVLASTAAWAQPQAGWVADPTSGCRAWTWSLQPGQTVAWSGACVEGLAQGRGVAQWFRDGKPVSRAEGEFLGGRMNGQGTATTRGGFAYDGSWRDGKPDGRGVFAWPNGDRYDGMLRDGARNGRGVFTWPDGTRYDGDWRDNRRDGQGVYVSANGDRYEGAFRQGAMAGQGVLTYADGARYEGAFAEDRPNGMGTYSVADGEVYSGLWSNGCFDEGGRRRALGATEEQCGFR